MATPEQCSESPNLARHPIIYPGSLLLIISVFLLPSCSSKLQDLEESMPPLYPSPRTAPLSLGEGYRVNMVTGDSIKAIVHWPEDTVLTGAPIRARGRRIDADSLPPVLVHPRGEPEQVKAHRNISMIPDELQTILLPDSLVREPVGRNPDAPVFVTPSGDTLRTGVPFPVKGKPVPCLQPIPTEALPAGIKNNSSYDLKYLDKSHGLSSNYITCILKDRRGHIWLGTAESGISRYDGRYLSHYNTSNGLSGNQVSSLIEDSKGNIWIGTREGGITKYDGRSFIHMTAYEKFRSSGIRSIREDSNGDMWFMIMQSWGGVLKYDGTMLTHYGPAEGYPGGFTFDCMRDSRGDLWFVGYSCINRIQGDSLVRFNRIAGRLRYPYVSLFEDSRGSYWFGSMYEGPLIQFDGEKLIFFTEQEGLSNNGVYAILEDAQGKMWFGTDGGVSSYDGQSFTRYTEQEGLCHNRVRTLLNDGSGNLWIGTNGGGISIFKVDGFSYLMEESGLLENHVTSLEEDQSGNLWFGYFGKGASMYDGKSFTHLTQADGLSSGTITDILADRSGNLWFTTLNNGVTMFNGSTFHQYLEKDALGPVDFTDVFQDSKDHLWFGRNMGGMTRYDQESYERFTTSEGLSSTRIISALEDRNGIMWFANWGGGVTRYDGVTFTHITEKEGLSGNLVSCSLEDSHGNLLFGTWGGGVSVLSDSTFTYLTEREGLTGNYISSLVEDSLGNIWVGTLNGLNLVLQNSGNTKREAAYQNPRVYTFDQKDLRDSEFSIDIFLYINGTLLDSKNRLWWCGTEGLTMLDMSEFSLPKKPPQQVRLNRMDINAQFLDYRHLPDSLADAISFDSVPAFYNYPENPQIPHRFNHLTFYLSAIDWAAPHKIRYSHMVEGIDEGWSEPSAETRIDYRNLPAGHHTLRVRAIGAAQRWSDPFEYTFTVLPPWWFSHWAFVGYGIIFLFLLMQYRRFLLRRARFKSAIEIERVEKEKVVELDRMKSRFFANISHEFRTPLTLILGPIEDLLKQEEEEMRVKRGILNIMRRNAKRLHRLVNQLLDLSKLETGKVKLQVAGGNLTEFIRTIVQSFLSLAESKNIKFTYQLSDSESPCVFDPDKIEKIVTNLISNAFKFTPPGGKVQVRLSYPKEGKEGPPLAAEICVEDTGNGIPAELRERIFDRFYQISASDDAEGTGIGLALTKELVNLYRGEIRVESEAGKGSRFTVTIPVSRESFSREEQASEKTDPPRLDFLETARPESLVQNDLDTRAELPVILIVEDNRDLRNYIAGNLSQYYFIRKAENGREGFERAIEHIPDLVVSDVMMPEMDGVEMCRRIKSDHRTSHIPMVLLTAKVDRGSRIEGLETGADDYISKPFDAEELQVRIRNLIEQRKRLREKFRQEMASLSVDKDAIIPQDPLFQRVIEICEQNLGDPDFTMEQLGVEMHLSRSQVYRKISAVCGSTPNELLRLIRLRKAASLIAAGEMNIAQVTYMVGYRNPSFFAKIFKQHFGVNPSEFKVSSQ